MKIESPDRGRDRTARHKSADRCVIRNPRPTANGRATDVRRGTGLTRRRPVIHFSNQRSQKCAVEHIPRSGCIHNIDRVGRQSKTTDFIAGGQPL